MDRLNSVRICRQFVSNSDVNSIDPAGYASTARQVGSESERQPLSGWQHSIACSTRANSALNQPSAALQAPLTPGWLHSTGISGFMIAGIHGRNDRNQQPQPQPHPAHPAAAPPAPAQTPYVPSIPGAPFQPWPLLGSARFTPQQAEESLAIRSSIDFTLRRSRQYRTLTSQGSYWEKAYLSEIRSTQPLHHLRPTEPGQPPDEQPGSPHSKQLIRSWPGSQPLRDQPSPESHRLRTGFRPYDSGPFAKRSRLSGTTVEAQAFRPGNRQLENLRPSGPESFRRSRYELSRFGTSPVPPNRIPPHLRRCGKARSSEPVILTVSVVRRKSIHPWSRDSLRLGSYSPRRLA